MITFYSLRAQVWEGAEYNENCQPQTKSAIALLKSVIEDWQPYEQQPCLDMGCGTGLISAFLAQQGLKVTGVDFSESMIETAQKTKESLERSAQENLTFQTGDARTFFNPTTYKLICCFSAIHWISHHDQVFKNMAQSLLAGGTLLVTGAVKDKTNIFVKTCQKIITSQKWESILKNDNIYNHYYPMKINKIKKDLQNEGLNNITIEHFTRETTFEDGDHFKNWFKGWAGGFSFFLTLTSEEKLTLIDEIVNEYEKVVKKGDKGEWIYEIEVARVIAQKPL